TETAVFAVGDPNAPVEIIEYTDFQCPFCQRHFLQTFPQIKAQYIDTGQVYYVFKDLPLTTIHPQAFLAAEAARCAADQGAYLEMHNLLFTKQGEWSGSSAAATAFTDYASQLGLDRDTFSACLTNHAQETAVQADMDEAIGFGISGTPAFFVNGNFVNGAQPFSVFSQVIDKMLADMDE
ncbi:MAG: DsbA family protein, partial [Anaerolineales bacterium]|nr:DsbA family protein [Anaerolineales bacterium]